MEGIGVRSLFRRLGLSSRTNSQQSLPKQPTSWASAGTRGRRRCRSQRRGGRDSSRRSNISYQGETAGALAEDDRAPPLPQGSMPSGAPPHKIPPPCGEGRGQEDRRGRCLFHSRPDPSRQRCGGKVLYRRPRPVEDGRVSINARRSRQYTRVSRGGRRVVVYSDNTTACSAVGRQGAQRLSQAAWDWAKKVVDKAEAPRVQPVPHHAPGRLNAEADAPSRLGEGGMEKR